MYKTLILIMMKLKLVSFLFLHYDISHYFIPLQDYLNYLIWDAIIEGVVNLKIIYRNEKHLTT